MEEFEGMEIKVFVIGGNHHNTLGVIRSLGKRGIRPYVIIQKKKKKPYIRLSKYIHEYWIVNSDSEVLDLLRKKSTSIKDGKKNVLIDLCT